MAKSEVEPHKQQSNSGRSDYWLVIGASAGGLEALKTFLENINCTSKCYIVIAQHLAPNHDTMLQSLLAKSINVKVNHIQKDTTLKKGEINIIGPSFDGVIEGNSVKLSPAAAIGPKPSIDKILKSLAEQKKENAIAVILSGTGSDGTQGCLSVRALGGFVLAQSADSAKYSGMPDSAISSGAVDLIESSEEMAKSINMYVNSSNRKKIYQSEQRFDAEINEILNIVKVNMGYDFTGYKQSTLNRRISRRIAVHQITTIKEYIALLYTDQDEVAALFQDFLISVTEFFRDKSAFDELYSKLREMIDNYKLTNIRVWVPGCANGEEAYTIAMLLEQYKHEAKLHFNYNIFATDIDDVALEYARKGVYTYAQIEHIEKKYLEGYFVKNGDAFSISKSIRDRIVFAHHDIVRNPPFSKIDLISCRNILIYMNLPLQRSILRSLHFSLRPTGLLFLGKAEDAESISADLYKAASKKYKIYNKRIVQLQAGTMQPSTHHTQVTHQPLSTDQIHLESKEQRTESVEHLLIRKLVPACVIIDDTGDIVHINGDLNQYLHIPEGKFDRKLVNLVKDELKLDIRNLLNNKSKKREVTLQTFFYNTDDDDGSLLMTIMPVNNPGMKGSYIIGFLKINTDASSQIGRISKDNETEFREELTKQSHFIKDRLETSLDELEKTNEELQSSNEELQSSNEELQSSNEALQTANEELQSTNQELSTVNYELELKSAQLVKATAELDTILDNIDEAVILIDANFRVLLYSRGFLQTYKIKESEMLNHPMLTNLSVGAEFIQHMKVYRFNDQSTHNFEYRYREFDIVLTIKTILDKADNIDAYIIFIKPSTSRNVISYDEIRKSFAAINNQSSIPTLAINNSDAIIYTNKAFLDKFGFTEKEIIDNSCKCIVPQPYNQSAENFFGSLYSETNISESEFIEVGLQDKNKNRILCKVFIDKVSIQEIDLFIIKILT